MKTYKAKVKATGEIIEGFCDGKGHFDVPVDHCEFTRYMLDEIELETPDSRFAFTKLGLTREHVVRLNNAINLLESLHESTDAKYLKEIKEKLLIESWND